MIEKIDIIGAIKLHRMTGNHEKDRNSLRKLLIQVLLQEKPGTGTGQNSSKYKYYVELTDMGKIFLVRPAYLKKGFDFVIHLENFRFSNSRSNPRHEDIINDLKKKRDTMKRKEFKRLCEAIQEVFLCKDPEDVLKRYEISYSPSGGELSVEALLKIIKWFFIEQDIRDWNYSGRNMLFRAMAKICDGN